MIRLLSLFLLVSCASKDGGAYLFPRTRQKHDVKVYGPAGELNAHSLNFLMIDESQARVTSLTPASLTAMKAIVYKNKKAELLYLSPLLEEQRAIVNALLRELSRLLWARSSRVPSGLKIININADGTVKELEWNIAKQRVVIKVEIL